MATDPKLNANTLTHQGMELGLWWSRGTTAVTGAVTSPNPSSRVRDPGAASRRRQPGVGGEGKHTVGLEIFDGHKLGVRGVSLGNGFC